VASAVVLNRLEVDDRRWFDFVTRCDTATAFHHPAWASLLADCYGYSAFALAAENPSGRVVAGLPVVDVSNRLMGRRWVSLPYTDACAPLVSSGCSLEDLAARLEEETRSHAVRELEVRARPGPHRRAR
jgi:CelD/BcsL family acetyltransferase involved in cellulose biosynthesis